MTVALTSGATNMLASGFGANSTAFNSIVNAAGTSPYFAGLLNSAAANNTTIQLGNESSTSGSTITINTTALNLSGSMFATLVAHELGHANLPGGIAASAYDPVAAHVNVDNAEGVAISAEYIVAQQLQTPMYTSTVAGGTQLQAQLDGIAAGANFSSMTYGSSAASAVTSTDSQYVSAGAAFIGSKPKSDGGTSYFTVSESRAQRGA